MQSTCSSSSPASTVPGERERRRQRTVQGERAVVVTVLLYDEASEPATRHQRTHGTWLPGRTTAVRSGERTQRRKKALGEGVPRWQLACGPRTPRDALAPTASPSRRTAAGSPKKPRRDCDLVETVDALGNADEERKFAFFGSSASPFGELTPVGMEPFRPAASSVCSRLAVRRHPLSGLPPSLRQRASPRLLCCRWPCRCSRRRHPSSHRA